MDTTILSTRDRIEEIQFKVLRDFKKELEEEMFNNPDPLDELLSMDLDEVVDLIKEAYEYYLEEEQWSPKVAKVKALEEFTLWYYGDKDKESALRNRVNEL